MDHLETVEEIIQRSVIGLESQHENEITEMADNSDYKFAIDTIEGKRHNGYDEKIKRQNWYEAVALGDKEKYDKFIRSYSRRETKEQLEERRKISIPRTPGVIGKLTNFIDSAYRQPKSKNEVSAESEEEDALLKENISAFGDKGETLLEWVEAVSVKKNMSAPNDYVLIKYKADQQNCYPEIIKSKDILNIRPTASGGEELVQQCTLSVKPTDKTSTINIEQYRYYGLGFELNFTELKADAGLFFFYDPIPQEAQVTINEKQYIVSRYERPEVPLVFPFGYIVDYGQYDDLFLPYWHKANFTMDACIQDGSKFDVGKYKHLFEKQINYVETCQYSHKGSMCVDGKMSGNDGGDCPKCNGTGVVGIAASDMDLITIKLPDEGMASDSVNPKDLVHYVDMPLGILEMLKKIDDQCYVRASMEIYGIDMGQKADSPITATQVLEDQGTGHSVVLNFVNNSPARLFVGISKAIAGFLEIKSPKIEYEYASDVSIVTVDNLIDRLKNAREAGAPVAVIDAITSSLEEKQQMSMSRDNAIQKALDNHKPFAHLPDNIALSAVLNLNQSDPRRVLWENFTQIATQIKERQIDFAELEYSRQEATIESIVSVYIEKANQILEDELVKMQQQVLGMEQQQANEES